jgi:hypothetical protein
VACSAIGKPLASSFEEQERIVVALGEIQLTELEFLALIGDPLTLTEGVLRFVGAMLRAPTFLRVVVLL